jgi:hypothetical protein
MHLFERCAALLLAELDARETGDRLGADALRAERTELHSAWEQLGIPALPANGPDAPFAEALHDAEVEIAHREAVDVALRERLIALGAAAARALPPKARASLPAGRLPARPSDPTPATRTLDLTF